MKLTLVISGIQVYCDHCHIARRGHPNGLFFAQNGTIIPLSTTDNPNRMDIHYKTLSREGVSLIVDETLAFLDAHKGCEDAFNTLLTGLGQDTGVAPASGTIRGVLERFRASGQIIPVPGSGGHGGGNLGAGSAGVGLGWDNYRSNSRYGNVTLGDQFFAMFLHEVTHVAEGPGASGSYTDEAFYNVFAKQGIYSMTPGEYKQKYPNDKYSQNIYSSFAGFATDYYCTGFKPTIIK
ncbi:MAG TPA: hypothetical protein VN920_00340 [Pyrinomonadaceae bacterium]|nr:hypothetical protein [Pyrinomonadaceae bacterium]